MRAPLILTLVLVAATGLAAEKPRLAVLVVIDQLGASTFEQRLPLATGGIKRMVGEGLRVKQLLFQSAPTVTSPGHATLATGAWPQTHGIVANEWFDEELGRAVLSTEDSRFQMLGRPPGPRDCTSPWLLRAPTLGDSLKAWRKEAKVVAISGKERSAILCGGAAADAVVWVDRERGFFTTSTYYAKELPPWLEAPNALIAKTVLQGLAPTFPGGGFTGKNPPPKEKAGPDGGTHSPLNERNEWQPLFEYAQVDVALEAVRALQLGKDEAPDFLSLSFSSHDFLAHQLGPDAPELEDTFRRIDFQIGRLLEGLDREVGKGRYVVALSADHGGSQNPELLKERRIDAGRVDGRGVVKAALETEADAALGPADWFAGWWTPGVFATPAGRAKIHSADARIIAAGRRVPGVAEVLSLPELMKPGTYGALGELYRRGAYPGRSPDFIVVPRPYWISSTRDAAAHSTPWLYDRAVPLVLFGAGVKKGELETADAVDVAPTLAALLGAPAPPSSVGRSIVSGR